MRTIDADALKAAFEMDGYLSPYMERMIDACHTVDTAKHGEWIRLGQLSRTNWLWRCKLCGCPQDYNHNYCPNCGAKMYGGEKDG